MRKSGQISLVILGNGVEQESQSLFAFQFHWKKEKKTGSVKKIKNKSKNT